MGRRRLARILPWILVILLCCILVTAVKRCSKIDACRCATDEGEINLWSLRSNGGQPRFNVSGKPGQNIGVDSLNYLWSPCVPWTFKPSNFQTPQRNCTNVAVCRVVDFPIIGRISNDIGEQELMSCELTTNTSEPSCVLQYRVKSDSSVRTSIVLQCDSKQKGSLDPFSSLFDKRFTTTLHAQCACPGRCSHHDSPLPHTTSIGLYILLVFVCCAVVYFIGGVIFNRIAKRARGKEMIPNVSFWMDLPYLIKDGVVFSAVFCYSCFKAKKGYTVI